MKLGIAKILRDCPMMILTAFGTLAQASEPDASQFGFLSGGMSGPARETPTAEAAPGDAMAGSSAPAGWSIPEWLHFDVSVQSLYDDNVFLSSSDKESAWINRVIPAVRIVSGKPEAAVWTFEGAYAPVWSTYGGSGIGNSFDQAVASVLRYNGTRLKAAAFASYREVTGNDRYIRDFFTTAVTRGEVLMNYELTGRTALESRILWEKTDREDTGESVYDDDRTTSLQISALWDATPITKLGPSIRVGYTESSLNPDRTFVDALFRMEYDSAALLKFSAQAGAQWVSLDSDRGSYWRPSVSLTGQYDMNPLWQLVFSAYARNNAAPSVLNADLQATGFNGSVRWKPTGSLQVSLGAGYEKARYEFFDDSPDRDDDYTYAELLFRAGREDSPFAFEMFYRHRLSNSSNEDLDFRNNQAGVQISRRF
jgi:hypothetical protein